MKKPIQVYYRTVAGRELDTSPMDQRPNWFSYEACWNNFNKTAIPEACDITVVIDGEPTSADRDRFEDARIEQINSENLLPTLLSEYENNDTHYVDRDLEGKEIIKREEPPDREKAAGKLLYNLIKEDNLDPAEQVIYIVEDDYIHLPGWPHIMVDFYQRNPGYHYISLYDHADKYTARYNDLVTKIFVSNMSHWRTVPSTCGTFAVPVAGFNEDYDIHVGHLGDHNKWMKLAEKNRVILSCVPGRATHCMEGYLSPFMDWQSICNLNL